MGWSLDDTDDDEAGWCACGVTDDLDDAGLCRVCSAAPHGRECGCDECVAYWAPLCGES